MENVESMKKELQSSRERIEHLEGEARRLNNENHEIKKKQRKIS